MRAALGIAAAVAALAAAAPTAAQGPQNVAVSHGRPGFVVAPGALPSVEASLRILRARHAAAPPGSVEGADAGYVLRLAARHLRGGPAGRRSTVSRTVRVNGWWLRRGARAPAQRVIVRDPDGVLSTYWAGRGFAVNPVASTGRWGGLNRSLSPEALADALLPFAVARRSGPRRFLLWEYYDVPDRPGAIRPGASGMAQSRMAQLLARAYYRTGEPRYAEAARGALAAFAVPVDRGGVMSPVGIPPSPWYVERAYPGDSPWKGAALNGFMVSILNLRSAAGLLEARPRPLASGPREGRRRPRAPQSARSAAMARGLAERGAATLQRFLPLHDTGAWSLYGLLTPGHPWRGFPADYAYHCYHVRLLRQLAVVEPGRGFRATARRWAGYAVRRGTPCA